MEGDEEREVGWGGMREGGRVGGVRERGRMGGVREERVSRRDGGEDGRIREAGVGEVEEG